MSKKGRKKETQKKKCWENGWQWITANVCENPNRCVAFVPPHMLPCFVSWAKLHPWEDGTPPLPPPSPLLLKVQIMRKKITRQEYVMKRNDILSTNSKFALQFHPHTHICMMDVAPEQIHHITWRGETCDYYNNDMQFCASWLDFITHSFCTLLQCNYVSLSSCFIEQRWSDIRSFFFVCVFLPVFPSLTDFIRNHCSLFELDILHFVGAGIVVCEWMNKIRKSPAKYASMSSKFIKINYQFLFIFKVPVHSHASHHTFAHTNDFVWCASERSVHFGVFLSMIFCR